MMGNDGMNIRISHKGHTRRIDGHFTITTSGKNLKQIAKTILSALESMENDPIEKKLLDGNIGIIIHIVDYNKSHPPQKNSADWQEQIPYERD